MALYFDTYANSSWRIFPKRHTSCTSHRSQNTGNFLGHFPEEVPPLDLWQQQHSADQAVAGWNRAKLIHGIRCNSLQGNVAAFFWVSICTSVIRRRCVERFRGGHKIGVTFLSRWQLLCKMRIKTSHTNSMKIVILLHFISWKKDSKWCCNTTTPESIHTKDESKRGTAFAFIFGVNWPVRWM